MGPKNGNASNSNIDYDEEPDDQQDISDNVDLNNVRLNTLSASEQEKEGTYLFILFIIFFYKLNYFFIFC